jgi:hypothetical protein
LCNFADQDKKPDSTKGDITTFEAKPMAANDLPVISNVAVTLSQEAVVALNGVSNVTAFVPGFPIGIGFVRAKLEYERH